MKNTEIQERIKDAQILWKNNRHEGAFMLALITMAAVAKKAYPKSSDRESFEQFFRDNFSARINIEYRGECHSVEHIFYKWFRCNLVHEGRLPIDIKLTCPDTTSLCAGGAPEYILKIGNGWFHSIMKIVSARDTSFRNSSR